MQKKLLYLKLKQKSNLIKWTCLVLFCFFAFSAYLLRPTLFGFDSYAHLNFVKFGFDSSLGNQPVANFVFGLFPDSLLFIKLFMVFSAILCIVGIFCIVARFFGERLAWISILLLVGLSPTILMYFGEFENELLAYPFIIWGIYFLLIKDFRKSIVCFAFSLLFWKWVFYLTFVQSFGLDVIEMNLFSGILNLWFLLPFVVGIVFFFKIDKWILLLGMGSIGLWLWNGKFVVFLLPFLALSLANTWILLEKQETLRKMLLMLGIFGLIGWNITYFIASPNDNDWFLVDKAIQTSKDLNLQLYADVGYDYWITYKLQKETLEYQQLWESKRLLPKPSVWITSKDSNCTLIAKKDELAKLKRVYVC